MAGNEKLVTEFLVRNKNKISLKYLGLVQKIESPTNRGLVEITQENISSVVTEDAAKKADIYVNGKGVSVKQDCAIFLYNRLQRANLLQTFLHLNFANTDVVIKKIDDAVDLFHAGKLNTRSRDWQEMFSKKDFKILLEFLMMKGSPNLGVSEYQADFILVAPAKNISAEKIAVYTFDEYFETYSDKIKVGIRRQWIGQISNSEHSRAVSLAKKPENHKLIYKDISNLPRQRDGKVWRADVAEEDRREVYMLFIEKVR